VNLKKLFTSYRGLFSSITQKLVIVVVALGIIMLILGIAGYDPLFLLQGLGRGLNKDIGGTIRWTAPLILCGLAIAIPLKAGVFNMGVDGQLYLGAITSTAIGLLLFGKLAPILIIFIAIIGGMLAGMIWALIPGLFRVLWGTDEVITTLLMNYVALLATDFLVLGPLRGEGATGTTYSTNSLDPSLWLPRIIPRTSTNIGFIFAIILAIIAAIVLYKTTLGYEIKLVGTNSIFARYAGIRSKKVIILTFLISGAMAGLTGAIEIFGVHHRFPGRFNPGLGFDGVVVSLLASNNPIAVMFSGFLFGLLRNGAMNMERVTEIPRSMSDIVQAFIIMTATATFATYRLKGKFREIFRKLKKYLHYKTTSSSSEEA
jgi:simple sugar transport system permease protein